MEMVGNRVVEDARQHMRLQCNVAVDVETSDHRLISGRMRDIGINSLYFNTDDVQDNFLIEGEKVMVLIHMRRGTNRLMIEIDASVVRIDAIGVAVKFNERLRWWPIFAMFPL